MISMYKREGKAMRTFIKVLLKGEFHEGIRNPGDSKGKKKGGGSLAGKVIAIILLALVMGQWGFVLGLRLKDPVAIVFLFCMLLLLSNILFGIFNVVNILYYVKDIDFYMSLPLSPEAVMTCKIIQALITSSLTNLIFLPLGIFGLIAANAPGRMYPAIIFLFVIVSVSLELAVAAFTTIIMRFSSFARNKDRFTMVFGLIVMVFSIAIGIGSQFFFNPNSGISFDMTGGAAGKAFNIVMGILCLPMFFTNGLFSGAAVRVFLSVIAMIATTVFYGAILYKVAKKWYFTSVSSVQSGAKKSNKKYVNNELLSVLSRRSEYKAHKSRDWTSVKRTPTFFNQFIVSTLVMPIYLIAILACSWYLNMKHSPIHGLAGVREIFAGATFDKPMIMYITWGLLGVVAFCGMSATMGYQFAVSRDGADFFFIKSLPVDWRKYIGAKLVPQTELNALPTLAVLIVLYIVFRVPAALGVYFTAVFLLDTLLIGTIIMCIGVYYTKLDWENEVEMMKGGKNVLLVYAGLLWGLLAVAPQFIMMITIKNQGGGLVGAHVAGFIVLLAETAGALTFLFIKGPKRLAET